MTKIQIPLNIDKNGCSKTILVGYYKYGVATLIGGGYNTTGTVVLVYEDSQGFESLPNNS